LKKPCVAGSIPMDKNSKSSQPFRRRDYPYYRVLWNRIVLMMLIPAILVLAAISGFFYFSSQVPVNPLTAVIICGAGALIIGLAAVMAADYAVGRLEVKRRNIHLLDQQMIKISRMAASARLSRDHLHHLKDLLANIDAAAACAEGADAGKADETVRENLVQIRETARSGHEAIHIFLEFTRPPGQSWLIREIDIHSIIDETCQLFEAAFAAKQLGVRRFYANDLPGIRSNPSRLNQVFQSLLLSIAGDVGTSATVDIHTASGESGVEVTVKYPSVHFDGGVMQAILDPLNSIQASEPGAWLALCVYTVGRIKGSIRSAPADDQSLAITIYLPWRLGDAQAAG